MVDALDSKSSRGNSVSVRVRPPVPKLDNEIDPFRASEAIRGYFFAKIWFLRASSPSFSLMKPAQIDHQITQPPERLRKDAQPLLLESIWPWCAIFWRVLLVVQVELLPRSLVPPMPVLLGKVPWILDTGYWSLQR